MSVDVATITDWIEIRELSARYNMAIDDGHADSFVALFTADATLTFVSSDGESRDYSGHDEIRSLGDRPAGQFVHATTDDVITIEGERASHVCTLLVLQRSPEGGTAVTNRGRYQDELVRTSEGWRFTSRTGHLGWPEPKP
jgi:SnoaL-like domain